MAADRSSGQRGSTSTQSEQDTVQAARAQLLKIQHDIRVGENHLKIARRRRKRAVTSVILGPFLLLLIYIMYWLPWVDSRSKLIIAIPCTLVSISFFVSAIKLTKSPGGPVVSRTKIKREAWFPKTTIVRKTEDELLLYIAETRDLKKMKIAQGAFDLRTRQFIYKDDSYNDIEKLRDDSKTYRRVNNIFQGVLIIGSASAAATAAFSYSLGSLRWIAALISLIVTISTGFIGYYKYKERSFYLQQTADSIEHEWQAFEVGGGRYKKYGDDEEGALAELVEELLRLNSEQKKRQQNLEQPPDTHEKKES